MRSLLFLIAVPFHFATLSHANPAKQCRPTLF
jgi:hypothetical protein